MKYTQSSFSVGAPGTDQYRENWERTFGKVQVKSCNRHSDCVAADQNSQALIGKDVYHCHDDTCEDCFGR